MSRNELFVFSSLMVGSVARAKGPGAVEVVARA